MGIKKDLLYNLIFMTIISIYCVEVCPHVSQLGLTITAISFLVILVPLFFLRNRFTKRLESSSKLFITNFIYFIGTGIIVGLFNFLYHSFPIESTLKIIVGAFTLGTLNAIIYTLESPFKPSEKRFSFANRISIFMSGILILIGIVWILLIKQNLSLFDQVQNGSMIDLVSSIIFETLFVIGILVAYLARIIYLYKGILQVGIQGQINSLQEVRKDNLDVQIPRFSNDEFSIIGDEVNQMIERLKKGKQIKDGFEKVTGKNIGTDLLERISEGNFSSEEKQMTVLFTDIKGCLLYTSDAADD